jgi:Cation transporting ATPase, C-terminus
VSFLPSRAAADPVRILGESESQDSEFQKKYLKLVGEEPTPVMPNEMEKLVRELPPDRHAFQNNQRRMYYRRWHLRRSCFFRSSPSSTRVRMSGAPSSGVLEHVVWGGVVMFSLALYVVVICLPFMQQAFSTVSLSFGDWLRCVAVASSVLWLRIEQGGHTSGFVEWTQRSQQPA